MVESPRHIRRTRAGQQGQCEAGRIEPRWSISLWAGTEYPNYYSCEERLLFESDSVGWHGPRQGQDRPQKQCKTTALFSVLETPPPHTHTHTRAHTHTRSLAWQLKVILKHWTISGGDFTQKISTSNSVCSTLQTHKRIEEMQTNTRPHTHAHEYT